MASKTKEEKNKAVGEKLKDKALELYPKYRTDMGSLASSRKKTFDRYMGKPYGDELKGRSQVISSDVSDTVESVMPALIRIFTGTSEVANLSPGGKADDETAKRMEKKLHFDFMRQNKGFIIYHDWFKDALLQKPGVVKYWWEKGQEEVVIEYSGVTYLELQALLRNPDIEIDDVTPVPLEGTFASEEESFSYDVEGRKIERYSRPGIANVKPEDITFDLTAESIQKSKLVSHRVRMHKNELSEYGLNDDDVKNVLDSVNNAPDDETDNRLSDLGVNFVVASETTDEVWVHEMYISDYDAKGKPKPYKLLVFGDRLLDVERNKYRRPPFCDLSAIRIPHRAVGRALGELVEDIQRIKTSLLRYMLDNIYFQNNGMGIANPMRINIDSLINANMPGGIALTKEDADPTTAYWPIPVKPLAPQSLKIWEMIEGVRENRVGVSRYSQGTDAKSLNRTASGIAQIMNAAQQRIELIARLFAETGVKDLFEALVDMNARFFDREQSFKVHDEWVTVSPQDVEGKYDVIIDVGSGTGIKEQKIQQMLQMLNTYGMLARMFPPEIIMQIFTVKHIRNIIKALWELMGYKNIAQYVMEEENVGITGGAGPGGGNIPGAGAIPPTGGGGPEDTGEPAGAELLFGAGFGVPGFTSVGS